jgi:hypothetical protein
MWCADPRVPLDFSPESGEYFLTGREDVRMAMLYCPFCGERLKAPVESETRRKHVCGHLVELAAATYSPVKYCRDEQDYRLVARDSCLVCFFYCPLCGIRLPLGRRASRFHRKSPSEVARLTRRIRRATTVERAIKEFGPPDIVQGPAVDWLYPRGKPARIAHNRVLFYTQLAETIVVAVFEYPDGHVETKLYPREREA